LKKGLPEVAIEPFFRIQLRAVTGQIEQRDFVQVPACRETIMSNIFTHAPLWTIAGLQMHP
jgi:hypothetical protein